VHSVGYLCYQLLCLGVKLGFILQANNMIKGAGEKSAEENGWG
jgi:hypothetical protein